MQVLAGSDASVESALSSFDGVTASSISAVSYFSLFFLGFFLMGEPGCLRAREREANLRCHWGLEGSALFR